ncbi:helix-turn-helix transcriptional regulator [Eubacteriales bacterium OttesenSCG-928-G02]|nr:helix-turn-helix transcriptional regulator [Eubacteriales bacterium OttesenSCG-928-G02]
MKQQHKEVYKKLKFNICYTRKMKNMSQHQLAERAGISRTHMSNIEAPNGSTLPSLDTLIDIANALNVPIAELFKFRD